MNFQGYETLSAKEQAVFESMRVLKSDTIWGVAVHNVIRGGDACVFRRLISQLKSQAADNPEAMEVILGTKLSQAVADL